MLDSLSHHPPIQGLPPCESRSDSRYRERTSYTPPEFVLSSKYKRNVTRMTAKSVTSAYSGRSISAIGYFVNEVNRPLAQAVLTSARYGLKDNHIVFIATVFLPSHQGVGRMEC